MTKKLIIIGAGMASGRALEHLLEQAPDAYDVTLFNAEPRGNYNRIMLSPVLAGDKTYEEIVTHDADWYEANGVTCRFGERVASVDRAAKTVTAQNGDVLPLFSATRSSVRDAGQRCAELLIERVKSPGQSLAQELWEAELVLGQSTPTQ